MPPILVAALTAAVFVTLLGFPFLNWDDQHVFVLNDALRSPGLVTWAFGTRYMEHYQPLGWLTWGAVERTVGLHASTAHGLNVLLHSACAGILFVLVRRATGEPVAAAFGALFWALHPLRVEVVAWASAMPYALALLFALLATVDWIDGRRWTAVGLFALSLLARPVALGLPLVWILVEPGSRRGASGKAPILSAGLLAVAAAAAESSARLTATLDEVGVLARLTMSASAPIDYLAQTLWPVNLTPLEPLALRPIGSVAVITGYIALMAVVTAAAWRVRARWPEAIAGWAAYLILLVPAVGLVPSGLQASADRYTYVPATALAIALAAGIARLATTRRLAFRDGSKAALAIVPLAAVLVAFGTAAVLQAQHWRSSIALWTRAVEIDAGNDVALYNLGAALAEAGRRDEAIARYEQALAVAPGYADARRNLNLLRAQALEDEGNDLAASRNFEAAVQRYSDAVLLDPKRAHAHAALGMALVELGRLEQARPHLRAALDEGHADPAVPNALAYVLVEGGERDAAVAVLREAQRQHPGDASIARNLAALTVR